MLRKGEKNRVKCNKGKDIVRERLNRERSGVLPGFLRTRPFPDRTSGSGGNLALKDITMGLRWVRENIGAFGGDPTRITLIGHDTGAALVNLLLLAPYSKGRRGIPGAISN